MDIRGTNGASRRRGAESRSKVDPSMPSTGFGEQQSKEAQRVACSSNAHRDIAKGRNTPFVPRICIRGYSREYVRHDTRFTSRRNLLLAAAVQK
jgi:hypothetical protein